MYYLYLCGKITDENREKELANIQKFHDLEEQLTNRGFRVFNPARLEKAGKTWEWYLATDLIWIHGNRPMLYLIEGWKESKGARLEVEFAKLLSLKIVEPL